VTPLEDELRGSLARQAGRPSAAPADPDQLADRVIRRARRLRRRRRFGGAATAVGLAAAAGLSLVYLPERDEPRPIAAASASPVRSQPARLPTPAATAVSTPNRTHAQARQVVQLPVDVLTDHRVVTTDGESIDVSFAGVVTQAYRVDAGWLVVGVPKPDAPASLWLVAGNGRRRPLLSNVDSVAVGAGGRRVAWRVGPRLWAGVLTATGVSQRKNALVMGSAVPVGFVGDGVLLARGDSGGYKVWWPDRGLYEPGWADAAVRVYGSLSDGHTVVAQVSVPGELDRSAAAAPQRCLALLDATRSLVPRTTACGLDLGARSAGAVSPDGRWLVTGSAGRTVLVDLTAPLDSQPRVLNATPPMQGGVVWLDEHTLVLAVGTGKVVVQLRLDAQSGKQTDDTERWVVPVTAGKPVLVIPRLSG
jgi:hypothetical protein